MSILASSIVSGGTLLKLVVGALVAGVGVTLSFSLLLYFADRAAALRREHRRGGAVVFQIASAIAFMAVGALVAYGLILIVSKPK
jgi:threonine/homoserine/homoserine lactone efflux protein